MPEMRQHADATDLTRPAQLARLLLDASHAPRKRARDQQADETGGALERRMLERLMALDPSAEALDRALAQIVREMGEPEGPARALALHIREQWQAACREPQLVPWLLLHARGHPRAAGTTEEGTAG
ncbi:MAG: hypothetical protein HY000_05390 [Planctomycetes bacterium]|nr:hypothetical protein [Planctomycetota bacterium]